MAKKAPPAADFATVFERLKAILKPYAPRTIVVKGDPGWWPPEQVQELWSRPALRPQ